MSDGGRPGESLLTRVPWYPGLLAAVYVLNTWRDASASVEAIWRPLVVAVAVTVALQVAFWFAMGRRKHAAAIAVTAIIIAIMREPAAVAAVASRLEPGVVVLWFALLAAAALVALRIAWRILRRPRATAAVTHGMNLFSALLVAVVLATAVADGSLAVAAQELAGRGLSPASPDGGAEATGTGAAPDIYVVLLDAYPRADTLDAVYGFDNAPFLAALETRGFHTSNESQSNYLFTQQTLISMLHMTHLDQLPDVVSRTDMDTDDALRLGLVVNNPAFEILRERGYEVASISAGYESVRLSSADRQIDTGHVNEFERHLIRRTLVMDALNLVAPDWLPAQLRGRVTGIFDAVVDVAGIGGGGPRFVFAHVPSPHSPNLFRADGSPQAVVDLRTFHADSPQDVGLSREAYIEQVREQLTHINDLALQTVDELLRATNGDAVVILMSDHGLRVGVTFGDPTDPNLGDRFATLFTAYTPGKPALFGDGVTNVNILPILFNAYFGTRIDCQPDHAYANGPGGYLDLHRVPRFHGRSDPACGRSP